MRISDWSLDVCSSDLFGGPALSDERDDFDHLACTQLYDALQGRAGIQAGAGRAGQRSYSSEGRGRCKSAIATEKLRAVRRPGRLPAAEIDKGDTAGENDAPGIAGQHRAGGSIEQLGREHV